MSKKLVLLLAVAAVLVLLLIGGVGFFVMTPKSVNVVGLPAEAAKAAMANAGYTQIEVANDPQASGQPPGTVTHVDYPGWRHAKLWSDPGVVMPVTANRPFDQVAADLVQAGLVVDQVTPETHFGMAEGEVVQSQPPGGAVVARGSKVELTVSHNPIIGCAENLVACKHWLTGEATHINQENLIADLKTIGLLPQGFGASGSTNSNVSPPVNPNPNTSPTTNTR
jgi:beta-lactam-binding protein with PASTA domain